MFLRLPTLITHFRHYPVSHFTPRFRASFSLLTPSRERRAVCVKGNSLGLHKLLLSRGFSTSISMESSKKFDIIVIGSGQAGTPLAGAFAKEGKKTALIEREHIGGCCINEGCTPTKTMIASGRAAYLTRRGKDYGIHSPGGEDGKIAVDMLRIRQRKRDLVTSFRGGSEKRTEGAGAEVLMGEARFKDSKTVVVKMNNGSEVSVSAGLIFINTGERPASPKLPGIETVDQTKVLNSTSIMELDELPGHMIVIGGGYVGLEFAQLFRRLGSEVTIIQRGKQLLPREDVDIAQGMLDILREDGLTVHLETSTTHVSSSKSAGATGIDLTVQSKDGKSTTITGTHLLFAAGRVPNTDMLNLQAAGISVDAKGYIKASEKLETTATGIYVLGDVKGPPAFTHISYDDFRIIRTNFIENAKQEGQSGTASASTHNRIVPYVVYTDPQLGHVGLHEREARQLPAGPNGNARKIQVAKMPMSYVARALETDETRGMMKAVVDGETSEILGFTCLGMEGGEIMAMVQLAMMGGLRYQTLRDAVWAHPSLAESLNNLWGFLE